MNGLVGHALRSLLAGLLFCLTLAAQGTGDGNITGELRVLTESGQPHPSPPQVIRLWLMGGPEHDRPFPVGVGDFSFKVQSGDYVVRVKAAGFLQEGPPIQIRVPSNGQTVVVNPPKPIKLLPPPPPPPATAKPKPKPPGGGFAARPASPGRLRLLLVAARPQVASPVQLKDCAPLTGVVSSSGKGVRDAVVLGTVYDERTASASTLFEKRTDEHGRYSLPSLPLQNLAAYAISIRKAGLEPFADMFSGCPALPATIALNASAMSRPDLRPELAEPAIRHTWTSALLDLPLLGSRSFDQFALLAPGVFPVPGAASTGGPGLAPGVGSAGQFSVNGLRARDNSFNLDGSDNNDEEVGARRQGFITLIPQPVESVQEFQLISALPSARYGRAIGGQINVITKSGTAGRHGSAYGLYSGSHWNARDFFDQNIPAGVAGVLTRPSDGAPITIDGVPVATRSPAPGKAPFKRGVFGFAYGEPLRHGRTYLYGAFEGHIRRSERDLNFSVPTMAERGLQGSGDRGLTLTHVGIVSNPNINIVFTPVNSFPVSVPGNGIFSLFPLPNNPAGPYGANTYTSRLPDDGTSWTGAFRLDRQLGRFGVLNGRVNFFRETSDLPSTSGALFAALRPEGPTISIAGIWTASLTPSTTNVFRASFGIGRLDFASKSYQAPLPSSAIQGDNYLLNAPLLLNATRLNGGPRYVSATSAEGAALLRQVGLPPAITSAEDLAGPLGQVRIAGFSPVGLDTFRFPQDRSNNTLQFADTFTATLGRTILIAGFDVRQVRLRSFVDRNARPTAQFHGMLGNILLASAGGYPTAATMAALGTPAKMLHTLSPVAASPLRLRSSQADFFFEVEHNVLSRLRLTAGVRLNVNRLPKDIDDVILGAFRLDQLNQQFAAAEARCPTPCAGLLNPLRSAMPGSFDEVFGADRMGNDARGGFAWDIFGSGRAVLRGGFGNFTGQFPAVVVAESRSGFPSSLPLNLANYPGYPFVPGASGAGSGAATTRASSNYVLNLANARVRAGDSRLSGVLVPGTVNRLASPATGTLDPISLLTSQLTDLYPVFSPVFPAAPLKHPYAFHQTLLFESQLNKTTLFSAGYVGTLGRKLLHVVTPDRPVRTLFYHNQTPAPDGFTAEQANLAPFIRMAADLIPSVIPRAASGGPPVNPTGTSRTFYETSASSNFHSFQAELRGRAVARLPVQYGLAITLGHAIDDVSDFFETAGAAALPQNSTRRDERASSGFDSRFRLAGHWIWDLPGNPGSLLMGGWRLSGIYTFQTAQPYTVNSSFDWNGDGNLSDRLDTLDGLLFGPFSDSPTTLIRRTVPPGRLLAPLLPGPNRPGGDGRIGRNTFRAHSLNALNVALAKQFRLSESLTLDGRIEAFNALNHANLGIPVRILEAPAFGQSVSTTVQPRSLQVLVRLSF